MNRSLSVARIIVILFGATLIAAGLAIMATAGRGTIITGVWVVGIGIVFVVAPLLERIRYRSDSTDRQRQPTGPGGGEPPGTRLEPRFRRSDEVFTDPTSGHRMRVWIDPQSGERRYLVEG